MNRYGFWNTVGEFFLNLLGYLVILPVLSLYNVFRKLLRDVSAKVYIGLVAIIATLVITYIVKFVLLRVT